MATAKQAVEKDFHRLQFAATDPSISGVEYPGVNVFPSVPIFSGRRLKESGPAFSKVADHVYP